MTPPVVNFDPDFAARLAVLGPPPPQPPVTTALEYRAATDAALTGLIDSSVLDDVVETKHLITSSDGASIAVYHFAKVAAEPAATTTAPPQPALVCFHGGGIVACPVDPVARPGMARIASETGVQVFAVEYRLAPEHPYPTPVEDCYAGLAWVVARAAELGLDAARVGVLGESGGAALAAGVSLMARDRGLSPPIARQILLCPMLDDRAAADVDLASDRGRYLAGWVSSIDICWAAYVGADKAGKPEADVSPYACPARARELRGLPWTYVDVGSLDLFRDESLEYGARLAKAGVDVELHLYHGVPHVFNLIAPNIPATLNAKDNRVRAIRGL